MWEFLKGKKTYAVALVAAITAALEALGYIDKVPELVWAVLAAAGLASVRHGTSTAVKCLLLVCFMLPVSGCSFLQPGTDTRKAAEALSETSWDKDSNLSLKENTTHNRRVVMAESANEKGVNVDYFNDGTPKRVENATQVLSQCSEPKDVMQGYMLLAQKNAEAFGKAMDTMASFVPVLTSALAARQGGAATGGGASAIGDISTFWNSLSEQDKASLRALFQQK